MNDVNAEKSENAVAKVKRHRVSPIWLIPLVATGVAGYLVYGSLADRGPEITLNLSTADGLVADQTMVKHKAVPLGMVDDIRLAPDMRSVVVKLRMNGGTQHLLTDHARFWVVRPRFTASSVTGLDTLVSGAYIEIDPGLPGGTKSNVFEALDTPPGRESDEPGHVFVLRARRLGSLSVGSPVYYRDVAVGELLSYDLGDGDGPAAVRVFVRDPYDKFVHPDTRFWNASGISLTTGPEGVRLELESISAVISGGIAFETREGETSAPAEENTTFELYEHQATAEAAMYRVNIPYVTYFHTSIQGLSLGSPVQLFGVQVGSVTDVKLVYDATKHEMIARVAFEVQPERALAKNERSQGVPFDVSAAFAEPGLTVVLESSSMITGSKDLAITYVPIKGHPNPVHEGDALVVPSEDGGGLGALTASLAEAVDKVNKIPFEKIGHNANDALASISHLANDVDAKAEPALAELPGIALQLSELAKNANSAMGPSGYGASSEFMRGIEHMMREMNDAVRSFRSLMDYLDRHPEALLRGRGARSEP